MRRNVRLPNLDRRWWVAIIIAVTAVIALGVSQVFFRGPSEACRPVIDMLDFNSAQAKLIASKVNGEEAAGLPTVAEDTAYQAWADGLAERAAKVTAPDLAARAVQVADLASKFVNLLPTMRSESATRAPGAPAPPVVYEMSALNDQIVREFDELSTTCKK